MPGREITLGQRVLKHWIERDVTGANFPSSVQDLAHISLSDTIRSIVTLDKRCWSHVIGSRERFADYQSETSLF